LSRKNLESARADRKRGENPPLCRNGNARSWDKSGHQVALFPEQDKRPCLYRRGSGLLVSRFFMRQKLLYIFFAAALLLVFFSILPKSSVELQKGTLPAIQEPPPSSAKVVSKEKPAGIPITLTVSNKNYAASAQPGTTAYEAMLAISSSSDFSFTASYYSGIGYFVTEINGMRGGREAYWSFYVNGSYSSVGVSEYEIKNGDVIEWKLEKIK
jgi:hypothetical protein